MAPRIAFISGPIDATEEYFSQHYKPAILDAIAADDTFVVGPIHGIDTLTLHFLLTQNIAPNRITVYMADFEYHDTERRKRYEKLGVNVVEAVPGRTTGERDAAMTNASDYDILRYRTERECKELYGALWYARVSNTEKNERRRAALKEGGQHKAVP
jgi:hypothetical protein